MMQQAYQEGPEGQGDAIIYSDSVRVESKVFYFDVKQNTRGTYLKVTEKSVGRPRLMVIVPESGLQWFIKLMQYYVSESHSSRQSIGKELQLENKVYMFSPGQNSKGCFLRVTESGLGHPAGRNSLVIPAAGAECQGWCLFTDALSRVSAWLQQAPIQGEVGGPIVQVGPGHAEPVLSSSAHGAPVLTVGPKTIFLDPRQNDKGRYLRITEVVRNERSSIIIPSVALPLFQQALGMAVGMINS